MITFLVGNPCKRIFATATWWVESIQYHKRLVTPGFLVNEISASYKPLILKVTLPEPNIQQPLKMDGWITILSCWEHLFSTAFFNSFGRGKGQTLPGLEGTRGEKKTYTTDLERIDGDRHAHVMVYHVPLLFATLLGSGDRHLAIDPFTKL